MRAGVNTAANVIGVIFGNARRAVDGNDTTAATLRDTIKPPPSMSPRAELHKSSAFCKGVLHGLPNVFVWMIAHQLTLQCVYPGKMSVHILSGRGLEFDANVDDK